MISKIFLDVESKINYINVTLYYAMLCYAKSLQSCPTLCDQQPTRLPHPWDSPGKNTGVGCHFFLPCMKVKSESEVAQSCPTLSDTMDCGPPGSSIHGIFQARVLEWGAIAFSMCWARGQLLIGFERLHFTCVCTVSNTCKIRHRKD